MGILEREDERVRPRSPDRPDLVASPGFVTSLGRAEGAARAAPRGRRDCTSREVLRPRSIRSLDEAFTESASRECCARSAFGARMKRTAQTMNAIERVPGSRLFMRGHHCDGRRENRLRNALVKTVPAWSRLCLRRAQALDTIQRCDPCPDVCTRTVNIQNAPVPHVIVAPMWAVHATSAAAIMMRRPTATRAPIGSWLDGARR